MTARFALLAVTALLVAPAAGLRAQPPAAVPLTSTVSAPEPDRLAAARELVSVVFPQNRREVMVRQAFQAVNAMVLSNIGSSPFMRQGGARDSEVQQVVKDFMARREAASTAMMVSEIPPMVRAVENAYARRFTVSQLNEIKAFFLTPTGQIYGEQSQTLMTDPDVVAWQKDLAARSVADAQRDAPALAAKLKAIEEKHKAKAK
jgi:hypothetical protein